MNKKLFYTSDNLCQGHFVFNITECERAIHYHKIMRDIAPLEKHGVSGRILRQGPTRLRFRSEHDIRWDKLKPEHAKLVRKALVRAEELRQMSADAGDAYLESRLISLLD